MLPTANQKSSIWNFLIYKYCEMIFSKVLDELEEVVMKKGDIISVDYELWIYDKEKGEKVELVETTKKEVAKEQDIYDENAKYEPVNIIVGREKPFRMVDQSFLEAEIGKEMEIILSPEEAFGKRDLKKIRFCRKDEIEPVEKEMPLIKGAKVKTKAENEEGKIEVGTILINTGRRINVDFNHPLAGKTLLYKYVILKKYQELSELVGAIFSMYYLSRIKKVDYTVSEDNKTLRVKLPDICKIDINWMTAKLAVISGMRETLEFEKIIFEEEYKGKKKTEEEHTKEISVEIETGLQEEKKESKQSREEDCSEETEKVYNKRNI